MRHTAYFSTNSTARALWLGASAVAVFLGCADLFGIEPSTRRSGSDITDGIGGDGGEAGDGVSATGGSDKGGSGGVSTRGNSMRGGAGGTSSGGTGTAGSVSGSGGAGANGGGKSGSGGESGGNSPEPDVSCETLGDRACSTAFPQLALECTGGRWMTTVTCNASEQTLCNPRHGACETVAPTCQTNPQGLCRGDGSLVDCATNPFSPLTHSCPYACKDGACLPGSGEQLIVHTELHEGSSMAWSGPIPVCFAADGAPSVSATTNLLRTWTQRAVERSFARYLNVSFVGWETCASASASEVVVEFLENCRGRLAGVVELGSFAPYQSRVGICRTFYDGGGMFHALEEYPELADFLARHQFGHVLGLQEEYRARISTSMVRALNLSRVDPTVWTTDIGALSGDYGYKPEGTIGTERGQCLSAADGVLSLDACSSNATQQFRSAPYGLQSIGKGECLFSTTGGGDSLGFDSCPSSEQSNAFAFRRVRFHTPGHCVAPLTVPVRAGTLLGARACRELGHPDETWSLEIVGVENERPRARIRIKSEEDQQYYCVTATEPFVNGSVPTLEPCLLRGTVFTFGPTSETLPDGTVSYALPNSNDRAYLNARSDNGLSLRSAPGYPLLLSGPIEDGNGHALAINPDDPTAPPTVSSLAADATPGPEHVFDVHF